MGADAAEIQAGRVSGAYPRHEQAQGETLPLVRRGGGNQRLGRLGGPGEGALEQPKYQERLDVGHQSHEIQRETASKIGPDQHHLAPIPIAQRSPDGGHNHETDRSGGEKNGRPELNVAQRNNFPIPYVERKEGKGKTEGAEGKEL